jgi:hypothetical protein
MQRAALGLRSRCASDWSCSRWCSPASRWPQPVAPIIPGGICQLAVTSARPWDAPFCDDNPTPPRTVSRRLLHSSNWAALPRPGDFLPPVTDDQLRRAHHPHLPADQIDRHGIPAAPHSDLARTGRRARRPQTARTAPAATIPPRPRNPADRVDSSPDPPLILDQLSRRDPLLQLPQRVDLGHLL